MSTRSTPAPQTEKLRQRNRELSILNAIAKALNQEVDLRRALQVALAQVAALFDLETGWIWLLHEDTGAPYLAAAQNLPPALADNPARMDGWCYCLETYRDGDLEGAANVNVVTCSRLKKLVDGTDGLRYHASIPLHAHDKKLGVLNVASTDWRELSPDDLRLLYTVGDLLGMAIERARLFARSVQLGAVEERNRLAREIHDTLAQGLSAVALHLETAEALLETEHASRDLQAAVRRALDQTRANLEEARRSVLDLRAAPLEGRTLAAALSELTAQAGTQGGLEADFEVRGAPRPLPIQVEAGLYRIAQEALANVLQHAAARRLRVRLTTTPQHIALTIDDDGRGFDPGDVPARHYGLVGLNERALLLGGRLHLETAPGQGTRVTVTIPI